MPASPEISVFVPTRGRAAKLAACLRGFERQTLEPDRFELLVALDGPDPDSARVVETFARTTPFAVRLLPCAPMGIAYAKNELLAASRGRFVLSINDDILPEPAFVEAHLRAQREALTRFDRGAMILGATPWVVHEPDRLFDRLIRDTSMVFFYDRMAASPHADDPWHDWGFRHAWNMNLSFPRAAALEAGGYTVFPDPIYYEDLELAHRLQRRFAMPVLHRSDAVAFHDHRYEPAQYFAREEVLGRTALGVARTAPDFAREVFGRDITAPDEAEYARAFVERERPLTDRLRQTFLGTAAESAAAASPSLLRTLYEHHLPLKRWHWRVGLLRAVAGESGSNAQRLAHEGPRPEKNPPIPSPASAAAGR
ncbi:MAG: glycosyltransferase family 2 protein [Phycisphaerales bacterium]